MADYYHYRQKIEKQRRRRNAVVALMVVLIILCAAAGFFWMSRHNQQANTPQAEPTMPTAETAATATPEQPEPTAQTPGNPQRLLPAVDNAAWDTATPVEQTIDLEYLNTDSRMAALPALGTVERSHFDTVTFLGDSITEGMECYATGYQNAHVRAYRGAGPESVVYNTTVKDHIRNVRQVRDNVGGHQDNALLPQGCNQPTKAHPLLWVQPRCGLVQNKQLRVAQQSLGNAQSLFHAAGVGLDLPFRRLGQPHQLQQFFGPASGLGLGQPLQRPHVP